MMIRPNRIARRYETDGMLEARSRLGSWCAVADELAVALTEIGAQWKRGRLTVAEEHVASDCLGDTLPTRLDGPKCLLACAGEDEHTRGLVLAELCVREAGWTPLWLGRRTPVAEIVRLVRGGQVAMVALSASSLLSDAKGLRRVACEVGSACKDLDIGLVLGGAGAWPAQPSHGVRMTSFAALRDYLYEEAR